MKILLASASFEAEYGGPSVSTSTLAKALAKAGVQTALWAPDGSAVTSDVIEADASIQRLAGSANDAICALGGIDLVHDSGVWMPHNHELSTLCTQRRIKRIVSPRGMLEPWAIRFKPIKKKLAWLLYQKRDLANADALHATSESEATQFKALGLTVPIYVAPNGVTPPRNKDLFAAKQSTRAEGDVQTLLFLSRIHPKKGLPLLIEAWARIRPLNWRLVIAGPDELGHMAEVSDCISRFGLDDSVEMVGPQFGEQKSKRFAEASLFILPTYSENFGIAVAEALAHGIPVITTTGAPWAELEEHDCGWWVRPDVDSIESALRDALSAMPVELAAKGQNGRELVLNNYAWDSIACQMIAFYEKTLESKSEETLA